MNNNDFLKRLHTYSENILPTDALDPETIEQSLVGVKRKSNKKILTSVCLFIFTICISALILAKLSTNDILTPIGTTNKEVESKTSYEDIYNIVKKLPKRNKDYFSYGVADSTTSISESKTNNYSETNIQVEGVDEGDVVKTDGNYIYSIDNRKIYITKADRDKLIKIATIKCNFNNLSEIYIHKNKLLAIGDDISFCYAGAICGNSHIGNGETKINIFDLSNIYNPEKIADFKISGNYVSSRKIGDIVYFNTSYCVNSSSKIDKNNPQTYCPNYTYDGKTYCIESENIKISNIDYEETCIDYTTLASVDLNNLNILNDMKSVLGTGAGVYSTLENYYVYSTDYEENNTKIYSFLIKNGDIISNNTYNVKGTVSDQFAIDKYNNYLRTVTQRYDNHKDEYYSIVSVYDSDTNLIGQLEIPTGKETIRSVRFDGDIAYFVTFETTDPLFTVDISNPSAPKILSKLKITGFSEYLHKINDNLLFGFGVNTNKKGRTNGLKLSLYDTANISNVAEIDKLSFGNKTTLSEAEYNHNAIYFDKENMIVGIPYDKYTQIDYYNYEDVYSYGIFKIDTSENKIININQIIYEKMDDSGYSINYARGVKIGNYFYIVTPHKIYSYDYQTFNHINTIRLQNVDY